MIYNSFIAASTFIMVKNTEHEGAFIYKAP